MYAPIWIAQSFIYYLLINNALVSLFLPVNSTFHSWGNPTISANFRFLSTSFHSSSSKLSLLSKCPVIRIHSAIPALNQNSHLSNVHLSLRRRLCLVKLIHIKEFTPCNFSGSPSRVTCSLMTFTQTNKCLRIDYWLKARHCTAAGMKRQK